MQFRTKLAAAAAAGATAVTLVAGGSALAGTHASARSVTGPEVIAGVVHGKAALANSTTIPLRWLGVVGTRSVIRLGGGSGPHKGGVKTFKTPAGNLTVMVTSKPTSRQAVNTRTCRFSFRQDIPVKVVGHRSTGAFAGASGPGAAQVSFGATAPRFKSGPKKGRCNPNAKPFAKGAVASFLASVVLTVRK